MMCRRGAVLSLMLLHTLVSGAEEQLLAVWKNISDKIQSSCPSEETQPNTETLQVTKATAETVSRGH